MDIQRKLLTVNQFSRSGRKLSGVKGIVLHWVANPKSSAMGNRLYFENLRTQSPDNPQVVYASAHFVVGISGDIVQCLPTDEMAYHVGAKSYKPEAITAFGHIPNNCTIDIELCHPEWNGKFTTQTLAAATELCATLCVQFDLDPISGIWTHHGITGKCCPKWFVDNPCDFEFFRNDVAADVERLRGNV